MRVAVRPIAARSFSVSGGGPHRRVVTGVTGRDVGLAVLDPCGYRRSMPNNLASFAIHAVDVQRARRFYEAVFAWRFEQWGPPGFYLIHTGTDAAPGIQGLLHERMAPAGVGGPNAFECSISVADVDTIVAAVIANGGTIVMPKSPIPTVGEVAYFMDPEGNRVGAVRYDTEPHT
jgi:predicted enzyme related to lactoylglutathione lyase